jgi:hypothetical protein
LLVLVLYIVKQKVSSHIAINSNLIDRAAAAAIAIAIAIAADLSNKQKVEVLYKNVCNVWNSNTHVLDTFIPTKTKKTKSLTPILHTHSLRLYLSTLSIFFNSHSSYKDPLDATNHPSDLGFRI